MVISQSTKEHEHNNQIKSLWQRESPLVRRGSTQEQNITLIMLLDGSASCQAE